MPTNGEQRKAYGFSLSDAYFRSFANSFSIPKEFPNTFWISEHNFLIDFVSE
jgi:hypothetical protein